MAFSLSRIDRIYREYDLGAALPNGTPVDITAPTVSLLTPRTKPAVATAWSALEQVAGYYQLVGATGNVISTHATFAAALTAWQSAPAGSSVQSRWRTLLAGPDAAGSGALVVPAAGADLWVKVADTPEIDAEYVERISVT